MNASVSTVSLKDINGCTGLNAAPYLTCIDAAQHELRAIAQDYWRIEIRHIVALRSDFLPSSGRCTMPIWSRCSKGGDCDISVAAYPEVHPEAKSAQSDLINLNKESGCGRHSGYYPVFCDVGNYLRFRDRCVAAGIDMEIVPGILPVFNFRQLQRFASMNQYESA